MTLSAYELIRLGTNTDAVLLDMASIKAPSERVMGWSKKPTSPDITAGIQQATNTLLDTSSIDQNEIACVTVGTTVCQTYFLGFTERLLITYKKHLINALVERDVSKLRRVGVIRLASQGFTHRVPPFIEIPAHLRDGREIFRGREIIYQILTLVSGRGRLRVCRWRPAD